MSSVYGSVAERAIGNRKLLRDADAAIDNARELFDGVHDAIGAMVFSSSLVTAFAHDLKDTCASLRANLYGIWSKLTASMQDELRHSHKSLLDEIRFIADCMDRTIDIAKMETTTLEDFTKCDIHDLVEKIHRAFERRFAKNKIYYSSTLTACDPFILCDGLLVRQVII